MTHTIAVRRAVLFIRPGRGRTTFGPLFVTPVIHSAKSSYPNLRMSTIKKTPGVLGDQMQKIGNTLAENFGGPLSKLGTRQFKLDECPDLTGKVAVITGGSEGIGFGVAYTLLKHNLSKLFIISVDPEIMAGAKKVIADELGQDKADRVEWLGCDLGDWNHVHQVAEIIKSKAPRLDMLVNNSGRGIMTPSLTSYGVDRHMAVNHMGHVILTSHLLPLMQKTAKDHNTTVRISNQSSNLHTAAPSDTQFASLEEINSDAGPNGQYGRSKLAGILYARYFDRNVTQKGHPNVLMNATHPGFVSTKQSRKDILEPYPLGGLAMKYGVEPFKKDQFEGAVPTVYCVTTTGDSGQYVCAPCIPEEGSEMSQNDELGDRLMELTRNLIAQKTRMDSVKRGCPMDDIVVH
ncbi:putative oxidoreductase bli-4 mitochondrial precursor [Podospora fimiseda]|uniref:Oxidoreductase bli-4 mitochondrial n=1 Tax=Podospora fimiseda TaxID=252190 RepID=A0AAN7H001_9PEZI|nr:putative oxidoreductase bli-4 mitochondrial precursor [Podospora fimiseda]